MSKKNQHGYHKGSNTMGDSDQQGRGKTGTGGNQSNTLGTAKEQSKGGKATGESASNKLSEMTRTRGA